MTRTTDPDPPDSGLDLERVRETFESSQDFTVGIEEEFAIVNPDTLELLGTMSLRDVSYDNFGVAVDAEGNIYLVNRDSNLVKLGPDGSLLESLHLPWSVQAMDLDLRPDGSLLVGSWFGRYIGVTSTDLSDFSYIDVGLEGGALFVAHKKDRAR